MPLINLLLSIGSVVVLIILIGLHLLASWYFYKRLRGGHNGVTLALLFQMLATAQLLLVSVGTAFVYGAYPSMLEEYRVMVQTTLLVSRLLLLLTTLNLVVVARIEAQRPLRRLTSTRRKLYSRLDKED